MISKERQQIRRISKNNQIILEQFWGGGRGAI